MSCFGDVARRLQETALDEATKGKQYIHSCLRQTVVPRVLRFWEAKNVKKGGELMGVDMDLVDEKNYFLYHCYAAAVVSEVRGHQRDFQQ
ncbi:hypothetical protein YC2023_058400 [Brassica napus]